jgi:hypothetical protein
MVVISLGAANVFMKIEYYRINLATIIPIKTFLSLDY